MEHFKFFVESREMDIDDSIKLYLKSLQYHGLLDETITNDELQQVIEKYHDFKEETLLGHHGKTAQYYIMYTNLVDNYLVLERSIRSGDFDLYK